MTKYLNWKDKNNKLNYANSQKLHYIYKYFSYNENILLSFRFKIMLKLQSMKNRGLKTKITNRCIHSTKVRGCSRLTNLVKTSLKDNLLKGAVNGFRKASW